ncbi:MAG: hypothetical protein PHY85_04010 [Bacteroidales bacterium]|nr:hypothetical protein [Bacteroidales bacterium]
MKKLIYGGLFLALVGIGFAGCKKDNVVINKDKNDNTSQIKSEVLNIFNNYKKSTTFALKNKGVYNIENKNNPFDYVGYLHNEVLQFIMSADIYESSICDKISKVNMNFRVNIINDCNQLFDLCVDGVFKSFDNDGNFKSDLILNLLYKNRIDKNEYSIINTTFLNVNDLDFDSKIDFIKDVEEYTTRNSTLNTEQKNRILRTFAIYRYSSYYWEIENPQPIARGSVSSFADACAEYWALNDPDSPAQDGKDVYAFAGVVSAIVHMITNL